MNILFLSFNDCENDGRSRELLNVACMLGNVYRCCIGKKKQEDKDRLVISTAGIGKSVLYVKFLVRCLKKIIFYKQYDCIFIDNYHASLLGLLARWLGRDSYIIQDSRELYTCESLPTLAGKFLIYCEHLLMRHSDVVICANKYRSYICKGLYHLSKMPLVYENIHWIDESNDIRSVDNGIKIVSTDGLMLGRNLESFLKSKVDLRMDIEYYILGNYTDNEYSYAQSLIEKYGLYNVFIKPRLSRDELGKFLKKCHVGIVKYNFDDMNNIFCASGKIYEFIMMGLPVVTTEQFELKEICDSYGVGVADNNFASGIKKILDNYEYYAENVIKYQEIIKTKNANELLYRELCESLRN